MEPTVIKVDHYLELNKGTFTHYFLLVNFTNDFYFNLYTHSKVLSKYSKTKVLKLLYLT